MNSQEKEHIMREEQAGQKLYEEVTPEPREDKARGGTMQHRGTVRR